MVISKSSSVKDKVAGVLSSPSMNQLVEGSGNAINAIKHISPNDKTGKRSVISHQICLFYIRKCPHDLDSILLSIEKSMSKRRNIILLMQALASVKLDYVCFCRAFTHREHLSQNQKYDERVAHERNLHMTSSRAGENFENFELDIQRSE